MKGIGVMVLLVMVSVCSMSAQTVEIEKGIVNQKLRDGRLSPKNLKRVGEAWKNLLSNHGGYLEVPYDSIEKKIKYEFIDTVVGTRKESIFNGILEWITLRYGSLEGRILLEDNNSGRLIINAYSASPYENSVTYHYRSGKQFHFHEVCRYKMLFTIKHGIYKVEFKDITFSHGAGRYYKKESKGLSGHTFEDLLPITAVNTEYWNSRMWSIKNTDKQIKKQQKDLHKYLIERKDSFDF